MSEVICLSDSDESSQAPTAEEANISCDRDEDSEFNFPAVEFHYEINKSDVDDCGENKSENDASEVDTPKNDYCYEDEIEEHAFQVDKPVENYYDKNKTKENGSKVDKPQMHKSLNVKNKRNAENVDVPTAQKKQKTIKPGDGLKTIKVCLDDCLKNQNFLHSITDALDSFEISWSIESLPIPSSIKFLTTNDCSEQATQKHILIIWNWDEAVTRVKDNTFEYHLNVLLRLEDHPEPMLVLCGIEKYFQAKKGGNQTTKRPKNKGSLSFHDAPKITRNELEICLIQIQQNLKCSCQMIDDPEVLGPIVYRFTKSVAQIPYKQQQREKLEQKLDWYAHGDNRGTVKVDNSGNGLSRLWQQQLCQFTLASLETAEAICSIYPSPLQLMAAYRKRTKNEGEQLLKDIPIRRAAGPLSTTRKLGPELSRKIFIMFTSKDGEATLGNSKPL